MKKIGLICVVMMIVIMGVLVSGCSNNGGDADGKIPDPGGEFCYETVIVSMTVGASAAKAAHLFTTADFLPEVVLTGVSVITEPYTPIYRTMLLLTFENSGRDNVLQVAYALDSRSDVYRVDLNVLETGMDILD